MTEDINPRSLYLSPSCEHCRTHYEYGGRTWCNSPDNNCEECGLPWVRYNIDRRQRRQMALKEKKHD